jgi:hypothetical protein
MLEGECMTGDPLDLQPGEGEHGSNGTQSPEQHIDLEKLAEKVVEKLLFELAIENERMGSSSGG